MIHRIAKDKVTVISFHQIVNSDDVLVVQTERAWQVRIQDFGLGVHAIIGSFFQHNRAEQNALGSENYHMLQYHICESSHDLT